MAFLDRLFNDPECSDLEFVIGVSNFPVSLSESNFSVMTGSITLLVALYAYFTLGSGW